MPAFPVPDDLDPCLTPARADIAASWLKDRVKATKYVEPTRQTVITNISNLYRTPDADQAIETQLLFGEPVDVFDVKDGWAWVQSARDDYVGYIRSSGLKIFSGNADPTHRVSNVGSFIFPDANRKAALDTSFGSVVTPGTSYKTTPVMPLSYGSLVRIAEQKDIMSELADGGFIPTAHLTPIDFHAEEPIAEAFRFLGVPYLWGGRNSTGVDCSSLIQLILQACNIKCPRNAYMQEKLLGRPIDRDNVQPGDLVFFRGHVGLMIDDTTMIHASDRAMAVSIDDLDEYVQWRSKSGKTPVKMFKRI